MMDNQQLVEEFLVKREYSLVSQLDGGLNSHVVLARDYNTNELVVVKFGFTQIQRKEIGMNIRAYRLLSHMGLSDHHPVIIDLGETDYYHYMILSYLGDNFEKRIRVSKYPAEEYRIFLEGLLEIYRKSLRLNSGEAQQSVLNIHRMIVEIYNQDIVPLYDETRKLQVQIYLLEHRIMAMKLRYMCFSNWDFTPDDTYIVDRKVMFSDPHDNVYGVPIIELACFSGLLKLIEAPDAESGQKLFEDFALDKVAGMLRITESDSSFIFKLARLFQTFMSIKYRRKSYPLQAQSLFGVSEQILGELTQF